MAIACAVRPWKLPSKTTRFGRPVTWRASFTAASVASAPELAKKKVSIPSGVTSARREASGSRRSWRYTFTWACRNLAAWSWIASTTAGWQCPVLVTAMPEVKSRYSVPSEVVTVQPEPLTTSRSVTRNQTSERCDSPISGALEGGAVDAGGGGSGRVEHGDPLQPRPRASQNPPNTST